LRIKIKLLFIKIISKPEEVLPNALFEGDIVLSKEQAEEIFHEYIEDKTIRNKRKVISNSFSLWQMPINYFFDGSHSK
jgi:hypothetical protein